MPIGNMILRGDIAKLRSPRIRTRVAETVYCGKGGVIYRLEKCDLTDMRFWFAMGVGF